MRVATWNIQLGARLPEVLEAIQHPDFQAVDLIALQEASRHHGRCDADLIAEALGPQYIHFQATAQRRRGRDQANALVWRRGVFSAIPTTTVLPLPGPGAARVRHVERTLLRVVPPQARMALRVECAVLRVYVVHLDVMGFAHRLAQFRRVLEDLAARPPVPLTLVAGDLNTFGPARPRLWRRIAAAAHSAGLINVTAAIRRTHWTGQKLDAIYARVSRPLASRAWTLKLKASDHLPVFADIELEAV